MKKLGTILLWSAWFLLAALFIVGGFMNELALGVILVVVFLAVTGRALLDMYT